MGGNRFADYRRGVVNGAMRSATPNVVRDCLDEIERQAARIVELEAVLAEYKRLYDLRGKALKHPCLQCGYVPKVIQLADAREEADG